jgi:TolA-binding protein
MASAATVFIAALAGSRFVEYLRAEELSYTLDGGEPSPGGYIPVSLSAESLLAFSDGSRVRMLARTRGRVVDVNRRGARFALQEGKVSVEVVHRPRTQWLFEAGPFLVTVHGTSFTIAWNPTEALFEMRLGSGAVSVTGPLAGREVPLRTGQTLRVNLRDQTSMIGPVGTDGLPRADLSAGTKGVSPSASAASVGTEGVPPSAPSASPQIGPPARPSVPRWAHREWAVAVAEGNAAAVLSEADRRGLSAVLDQAASEDLWALANAARYMGRYSLARQALVAQRRRFPSSERAREAAFFLGRLDDGSAAGPEEALGWYDRYLAEAPDGTHAPDALGRKMTVLERWNRRDEASTVARDYLRRFPRGIYSNAARALVRAHR